MIYLVESKNELNKHMIKVEGRVFYLLNKLQPDKLIRFMSIQRHNYEYYDLEFGNLVSSESGLKQKIELISDKFGYTANSIIDMIIRNRATTLSEIYSLLIPDFIILYIADKLLLNNTDSVYINLSEYMKEYMKDIRYTEDVISSTY